MKNFRLTFLAIAVFVAAAMAMVPLPTSAQFIIPDGTNLGGHLNAQGNVPVGTNCTIAAGSTDTAGSCTTTNTSGSIAFARAFTAAPTCLLVDSTATPVAVYTTTTAQITLTSVTNAHVLFWFCIGKGPG